MMEIFKSSENGQELYSIENIEKGCWINLVAPTEDEMNRIQSSLGVSSNFLRDPLDEEEKPRIDVDGNQTLIIVDVPYVYEENKELKYETIPMGLLVAEDCFITICLKENTVLRVFRSKKVKEFFTFKKTRFTFQILFEIAREFLTYLRHINKKTDDVERALHKSMKNKELLKLLDFEKSLVFFTTSLKSNEIVMEKLLRGKYLKMYEEDQDLLEDVIIENKQAIEMANIYSSILSGMMDAFASVISNNLNIVMKFLTSVTIVLSVPTMISSFFGMNVPVPYASNPLGFFYVLLISLAVSLVVIYILSKKEMF
ncbi:magnesium transporter [Clostridium thermosuccinogenes]|uniref:Magnesium transporter n=1 Tax=Clostridium thermosuccinogenes TaxID=84032 RepID=A0A2K2FK71_9CLOT|nr:magnesium transporter CorA family protein [Pseudoclostridium thermosuccinogenes]AUS95103.1 magnesium transporter [Pseudoclostridium thermosuccinogenes]PNT99177.1 magnesium transporter [Pseudoclostridium thermosuccinogenes]PNU00980.1 magnesium transporter [Pseudoclostridium thermosuccinogenes]